MDCETPVMLAMVAVGAIAITLEFRMPFICTLLRKALQSSLLDISTSKKPSPRSACNIFIESIGKMPRLHKEPEKLA